MVLPRISRRSQISITVRVLPSQVLIVIVLAAVCAGCSSSNANSAVSQTSLASEPADYESDATRAKLDAIWLKRGSDLNGSEIPIGPGDVLRVSLPGMDEMSSANSDVSVRVAADGKITLPLIGTVQASHLTQNQLEASLKDRFSYYMYDPPVRLFVTEYHSREVGVFGAVAKPGLYDITGPTDTIQSMLATAGGMTDAAAQHIQFTPAPLVKNDEQTQEIALHDSESESADLPGSLVIDLHDAHGKQFLKIPVRAGDSLVVPILGQVMVEGWVQKPGPYPITPHMTVSGAIAAAGGAIFAADTSEVKVIRSGANQGLGFFMVDIEDVKEGRVHDVPLQSADVVEVSVSDVKIVPYGVYSAVTNLFRMATYFPVY